MKNLFLWIEIELTFDLPNFSEEFLQMELENQEDEENLMKMIGENLHIEEIEDWTAQSTTIFGLGNFK